MSRRITANFAHYQHTFSDAELMKWGSSYHSRKDAGQGLRHALLAAKLHPVYTRMLSFSPSQIVCANEVFPESAVAEPVADLEVWDQWRTGIRAFPFPGKYSRLGLAGQEKKVASTTSMGVIGEILTGLMSQSYIHPWVLVRPICHWPDFIFYTPRARRYAFVESKATFNEKGGGDRIENLIPPVLCECLREAVQQLNSDPFVKVWLSFTTVTSIVPLRANVLFLELDVPSQRRAGYFGKKMPQAVVIGLAQRAVDLAAPDYEHLAVPGRGIRKSIERESFERALVAGAKEKAEEVLMDAADEDILEPARGEIEKEIVRQVKALTVPEDFHERTEDRMESAKVQAVQGRLGKLREHGGESVFMADLTRDLRAELEQHWEPDWEAATRPWGVLQDVPLWRCSSALLGLGDEGLGMRDIHDAGREAG